MAGIIAYIQIHLNPDTLRQRIILSANRALLNAITPHLRAITIHHDDSSFIMRAYYDKGATVEETEILDAANAEIIADLYPAIENWSFEVVEKPYPEEMNSLTEWIFKRHET